MQDQTTSRRSFYLTAIYGLWGVITAALALPAAVYLLWPPRARKQGEWVEAGQVSQLQPEAPDEVVFRRNVVDGWQVSSQKTSAWLVKNRDGSVVAFAPQCTHLGCAYHWDDTKTRFVCPCHASAFDLEGKVLYGPAPRPLDRYEVKVEGAKVLIGALKKNV